MIALAQADRFAQIAERFWRFVPADIAAREPPIPYPVYGPGTDPPAEPEGFLSPDAMPDLDGPRGACVIGLIDDGIPFAHERLRHGGSSRVASIWLQDARSDAASADPHAAGRDLGFGRELRGTRLTDLIARHRRGGSTDETALYAEAGATDHHSPSRQTGNRTWSHGSATIDVAAGFSADDALARQFPIIAVSLLPLVTQDTSGTFVPYFAQLATLYILQRARRLCRWLEHVQGRPQNSVRLPIVINFSYGMTAGPRDGMDPVARFQDAISSHARRDVGPIRFVLPMGNHRQSRCTARLSAGDTIDWLVQPDDRTPSFIEFWTPAVADPEPMRITVTPPGASEGVTTRFTGFGQSIDLEWGSRHLARAYLQRYERAGGTWRSSLTLAVPPTVPVDGISAQGRPGRWTLRLDAPGQADVSVHRDDSIPGPAGSGGRQSCLWTADYRLFDDIGRRIAEDDGSGLLSRQGTLNALACGQEQIRVGGMFADETAVPYSGLGRAGEPFLHGTRQALSDRSTLRRGLITMGMRSGSRQAASGTSIAAPAIAREVAFELAGISAISEV